MCGRVGPAEQPEQQPPATARNYTCGHGDFSKLFLVSLALALSDTLERFRQNLAKLKEAFSEIVVFSAVT
jgi:hypothetical protein